jgi:orotate phosphoribosyltransferase
VLEKKSKSYNHRTYYEIYERLQIKSSRDIQLEHGQTMTTKSSDNIARLKQLLIERSVKRGSFVLASGKHSDFYIDARLTTMSPEGLVLIGQLGLEAISRQGWTPDSIGGLTMGADPVSFAISHTSALENRPIRAFSVRKEAKGHGTGNRIEGPFTAGDRVVVIEDVITTGKSALQAIDAIESAGGKILGVLAIVDRQDGGSEAIQSRGYFTTALATIAELK